MFHEGSLQSGISLSIQEKKLVACFVRDDSQESAIWEDDWLQSGWISSLLEQKVVLLRLEAGSTEAGFLSAFCPIDTAPSFIIIQSGQLREQIMGGVGKDEFINRIRKVLGAAPILGSNPQSSQETASESPVVPVTARSVIQEEHRPASSILPPSAKAKGKQKVTPPAPKPDGPSAQQAARDALRKRKHDENLELARIQAEIEKAKAERKAQAEARKADRERLAQSSPTSSHFPTPTSTKGSRAQKVHINVRLFDGRTIRSTFDRTTSLQNEVRSWVDQEFTAMNEDPSQTLPPYYFRQILAPLPSRELSAGDESETLGDIDLAPSATLVLIPVKGFTEAYAGGGGGVVGGVVGGVTGLVGGVFSLASSAVGYVGSALGSVVGYGQEGQAPPGRTLSEARPQGDNVRVTTLADQRAREPRSQELYNGNQLNFEPRDDDSSGR
ncbi:hypothetical protein K505DRAFT_312742 [Melanomma pulvis-pyrius CBS 109.77]|uniref:UBX domain-containing protein 2 n=1 Tax=Melanomma pulvis-pyrius CBS 109.77 TaxID=1314802 RepID=A0A6A6X0J1_9PLEO|nr:hypothetical protein K505DRAFT_312742 [Melanomma pulvis-pyrius CBS 109.77]